MNTKRYMIIALVAGMTAGLYALAPYQLSQLRQRAKALTQNIDKLSSYNSAQAELASIKEQFNNANRPQFAAETTRNADLRLIAIADNKIDGYQKVRSSNLSSSRLESRRDYLMDVREKIEQSVLTDEEKEAVITRITNAIQEIESDRTRRVAPPKPTTPPRPTAPPAETSELQMIKGSLLSGTINAQGLRDRLSAIETTNLTPIETQQYNELAVSLEKLERMKAIETEAATLPTVNVVQRAQTDLLQNIISQENINDREFIVEGQAITVSEDTMNFLAQRRTEINNALTARAEYLEANPPTVVPVPTAGNVGPAPEVQIGGRTPAGIPMPTVEDILRQQEEAAAAQAALEANIIAIRTEAQDVLDSLAGKNPRNPANDDLFDIASRQSDQLQQRLDAIDVTEESLIQLKTSAQQAIGELEDALPDF